MDVDIIGGGINGLTVGLLLCATGHEPTIYTRQLPSDYSGREAPPNFATLYAPASVIPHSYNVSGRLTVMRDSLHSFGVLAEHDVGVRLQPHYELSENEQLRPWYLKLMDDARTGQADELSDPPVRRLDDNDVYGCTYQAPFVAMPRYLQWLENRFRNDGGEIKRTTIRPEDLSQLPASQIVNTTGAGSLELFGDEDTHYLRGHLVRVEPGQFDEPFSYNYCPDPSIYARSTNEAGVVYAYPRDDALLLGGTRQYGRHVDGAWMGYEQEKWRNIDGVKVPEPIITLNQTLLEPFGVDVERAIKGASYGLRPCREGGARLEAEEHEYGRVIHNYGHGGAGVAYSWGCAFQVLSMFEGESECTIDNENDPVAALVRRVRS